MRWPKCVTCKAHNKNMKWIQSFCLIRQQIFIAIEGDALACHASTSHFSVLAIRATRQITARNGAKKKLLYFFCIVFGNVCQLVIHRKALAYSWIFEVQFKAKQEGERESVQRFVVVIWSDRLHVIVGSIKLTWFIICVQPNVYNDITIYSWHTRQQRTTQIKKQMHWTQYDFVSFVFARKFPAEAKKIYKKMNKMNFFVHSFNPRQ